MNALIVYDSYFGNTEQVAQAVGAALTEAGHPADVRRVGDVQPSACAEHDLLVVGSPTRAFSPSDGTKKFLRHIPNHALRGVQVAAFDTRIAVDETDSRILPPLVKLFGYAASPIAKQLQQKDGELPISPEGFIVDGTEGPLKPGELERAGKWAKQIVTEETA